MSVLLAGGGLRTAAVGATNARAEEPVERAMDSNCLLATSLTWFGIDTARRIATAAGDRSRSFRSANPSPSCSGLAARPDRPHAGAQMVIVGCCRAGCAGHRCSHANSRRGGTLHAVARFVRTVTFARGGKSFRTVVPSGLTRTSFPPTTRTMVRPD